MYVMPISLLDVNTVCPLLTTYDQAMSVALFTQLGRRLHISSTVLELVA